MATADSFVPIAPRPPPGLRIGPLAWLQRSFFDGGPNTLLTLAVIALLALAVPPLFNWAVWYAVATPDNAACRAAHGTGACWGVVAEKGRLILFGRYPVRGAMARAAGLHAVGCAAGGQLPARVLAPGAGSGVGGGAGRLLRADARRLVRPVGG